MFGKTARRVLAIILTAMLLLPAGAFGAGPDIKNISPKTYSEGLMIYQDSRNKYGYLDADGNVTIKAQFLSAHAFKNGYAVVQVSTGKYAVTQYIDKKGKVVVKGMSTNARLYEYEDWAGTYGPTGVWRKNKDGSIDPIGYNYITEKGKLLNQEEYLYIGPFSEGYALVGTGNAGGKKLTRMSAADSGTYWLGSFSGNSSTMAATKFFYIDAVGNPLGNLTWSFARAFRNGFAAVAVKSSDGSYRWGFINQQGTIQASPEYASVGDFSNGMAWVSDGEKYGYINEKGDLVIPMEWSSAKDFDENGLAVVAGEYYSSLIDKTGTVVLDTQYSYMTPIRGKKCYIVKDGVACGMTDQEGNVIVPPAYQYMGSIGDAVYGTRFSIPSIVNEYGDFIAPVMLDGKLISEEAADRYPDGTECKKMALPSVVEGLDMCTFLDMDGNIISMNLGDYFRGEKFSIQKPNGKTVLMDLSGNRIGDGEWDGTLGTASTPYAICVKKGESYGFIDRVTGETLLVPQYTSVSAFSEGVAAAMLGDNCFFVDEHARPVLKTVTKASSKEIITALQQTLTDQGFYKGKINGSFSNQLTQAIKEAQGAFGMEQTGIADSEFQYRLKDREPAETDESGKDEADEIVGVWNCKIQGGTATLTIEKDGSAVLKIGSSGYQCTWEREGSKLTLTQKGIPVSGTYNGTSIELNVSGTKLTFVK